MAENDPSDTPAVARVGEQLHALSELLRTAQRLDPEAQEALADLVDELGRALESGTVPAPELSHLTATTAQLARALHERHDEGVIAAARDRLGQAVVAAENEAPLIAGMARRVIDTLANLGI